MNYQVAWLDTYIPIGIIFFYFGGLSLLSYFATYYLFFPIQARHAVEAAFAPPSATTEHSQELAVQIKEFEGRIRRKFRIALYILIILFFGYFFIFYPATYYLRETGIFYPGTLTSLVEAVPSMFLDQMFA